MAMFLSRIKKALNLGTKSITENGTYNASTDGYDGYSSVEVNVAGGTATPITPSNSSPAAMTANTPVNPTANGYAIESYTEVVPSNASPATLSNGSIYKIKTNGGKAVASITDVTPSSTPTSVSANDVVKIGGSGVIVDSIPTPASLTPSNSSPVALAGKGLYRVNGALGVIEGYAIESYSSKTPSDSSPASVSSGAIIKASSAGYLYATQQPKVKRAIVTLNTSTSTKVTLGWTPKYVCVYSTSVYYSNIYDEILSTTQYIRATSSGPLLKNMNTNYSGGFVSIDNDGFTLRYTNSSAGTNWGYFAIG